MGRGPRVGDRLINARAETVPEKPAFKTALERRRCIVPADGFYEWQRVGAAQAADVHPRPRRGAARVRGPVGGLARSGRRRTRRGCAPAPIVTTDANATMAPVHDRMPVMLAADAWDRWLDRDVTDGEAVVDLLRPAPDDLLELWPVSPRCNSARHDDERLIEREDPLTLFG